MKSTKSVCIQIAATTKIMKMTLNGTLIIFCEAHILTVSQKIEYALESNIKSTWVALKINNFPINYM